MKSYVAFLLLLLYNKITIWQALKTQGVWHSAQMMPDFRQKTAGILCVFQGFLTTKTALVGHYDECRDVFRGCLK